MKKTLIVGSLAALVLGAFVALGAIHRSQNFINGRSFWVTNNSTHVYSDTNIVYTNSVGTVVQSTNVPHWADAAGFADLNGNPSSVNVQVKWTGTNANSSNTLTFTFVRSGDGSNFDTLLSGDVNSWAFTTTPLGTTSGTLTTNVPTWFTQGARAIRLAKVAVSSVSNSGTLIINALSLNGFVP